MSAPSSRFDAVSAIAAKRDGGRLARATIESFLSGYVAGRVSDAQAAAMCMAIVWRGLDGDELSWWTQAMMDSGPTLAWPAAGGPVIDKHSTGGVGDKVSLILAPLLAAAGARVPMLSGRGLGSTGGTLDKLESIPGLRTELGRERLETILEATGCFIAGAGADLVPADRGLYALRDVTATVDSLALIASSVMSKKLAGGAHSLVLDVKYGAGAFCDRAGAELLARSMVEIGERHGLAVAAVLSPMHTVLGRCAGNACEVAEAIEVLSGGGPDDVRRLTLALGAAGAALAGLEVDEAALAARLDDGSALRRFEAMVVAQGGDPGARLPTPDAVVEVRAEASGTVVGLDAAGVGRGAWLAGAGRAQAGAEVDPAAGVELVAVQGEEVVAGQVVATAAGRSGLVEEAAMAVAGAYRIGDGPAPGPDELCWVRR